jgi:hypothetical protein
VLVLLALGVLGGYAYAGLGLDPVRSDGAPAPLEAADPALPFTPPEKVNPDADLPPVATDLPVAPARVGSPPDGIVVPAPVGWERTDLPTDEARWSAPGRPIGSYAVRVQVLDRNRSIPQAVAERAAALPLDPLVSDLEVLDQSGDTLRASFILGGYRKLTIIRWVSFDGGLVDVEIAATGRLIDQPGLEALVARMATDVRRQPERGEPEE